MVRRNLYLREDVIAAALAVVREEGLPRLSARLVARRLGASTAPVYSNFPSMEALAAAVKLAIADLEGGTFTISNGGTYGSMLSTPLINPPQSGVLGMHAIQHRPVARNGQVVIRPMMYLALSYDHRLIDGREAVGFLKLIKERLENTGWLAGLN